VYLTQDSGDVEMGFEMEMEDSGEPSSSAVSDSWSGGGVGHTLASVLKTLFAKVEEVKLDMANHHLDVLRAYLATNGIAYEQAKMNEKLRSGEITLERTSLWLQAAAARSLESHVVDRSHLRDLVSETCSKVLRVGLVLLLEHDRVHTVGSLPETLRLDAVRIGAIQNGVQEAALVCSIVMLVGQSLARKGLSQHWGPGDSAKLGRVIKGLLRRTGDGVTVKHLVEASVGAAIEVPFCSA
jgi:T-complex protein 11